MMGMEPFDGEAKQEITIPVLTICAAGHVHLTISTDALPVSVTVNMDWV
jgi:hypothetical protein